MSRDWDSSDLARLLALEHAFGALALISASNFAQLTNITTSEAIAQFRSAIEGAIYDTADTQKDVRELMRQHLRRMFDHIAKMASQVGPSPNGAAM